MKAFVLLSFLSLFANSYSSDVEIIDIHRNKEILMSKKNNVRYLIEFKNNIPRLLIKEKEKILDALLVVNKQLDKYQIEYSKIENSCKLTVKNYEPQGGSSGISIYTIRFIDWSENTPGFFIENVYVSIGEGLPIKEYKAIAINNNKFQKNKWEDSSYEININSNIPGDPYDYINVEYKKNNNKTQLLFKKDKSEGSKLIFRLFYSEKLGFKTINK